VDVLGAHPLSPSGTARWSGTSFATAIVTGGFALLRERRPGDSSADLLARLVSTGVDVDEVNAPYAGRIGRRIDLAAATAP
jgi:subtilisin family serine protease